MDYLDRVPLDWGYFEKRIDDLYKEGLKLVEHGKLFGVEIDITNPKEVIASLYVLYTLKETLKNTFPTVYVKSDV